MTKLENTAGNKLKVAGASMIAFAIIGFLLGKGSDKKSFAIGGLILGLLISQGIGSWIIKEPVNN